MEMKFDPMTGQPIQPQNEQPQSSAPEVKFDPMTGQPIQPQNEQPQSSEPEMKFDPMTGQPIQPQNVQPQSSEPEMKFDPMTGQPVTAQRTVSAYDPMTGQPIYGNVDTTPLPTKKGMGKGAKIAIAAVAAIAVIGTTVGVSAKNGAFLSKEAKVGLATINTFKEQPQILEDANIIDILSGNTFTLGGEVTYEGESLKAEYRSNKNEKQLAAYMDIAGVSDLSAFITLDKEKVQLACPEILDEALTYYYTADNDGMLIDMADDDEIQQLNDLLAAATSGKKTTAETDKYVKEIVAELKAIKFDKISSEKFEVDGKERSCKGYLATITPDNINNIIDTYMDYMGDLMSGDLMSMTDWSSFKSDVSELQKEIDRMDDIEIEFFTYKNMLACIRTEVEGNDLEILFLGGDYRMQNVEVNYDGDTYFELKGEKSGSEETIKFKAAGQTLAKVTYDEKSGDYNISIEELGTIKGNIEHSRKGVTVTVTKFFGYDGFEFSAYAKDSADFDKVDEKDSFDIGNADESDWNDLIGDIDTTVLYELEDALNDVF